MGEIDGGGERKGVRDYKENDGNDSVGITISRHLALETAFKKLREIPPRFRSSRVDLARSLTLTPWPLGLPVFLKAVSSL